MLGRAETERLLPAIGPDVAGASFCPLDGHADALRLFRALHAGFQKRGGRYLADHAVDAIAPGAGGFRLATPRGEIRAGKLVLAAGLGNARLAPMVGLSAPVRPQRGHILVTERVAPFLAHPLSTLRQTGEGSVMIGDSQEEAGFDNGVDTGVVAAMAARAVRAFPLLARANVVRSWAALRVMTRDGFPIYEQSAVVPGRVRRHLPQRRHARGRARDGAGAADRGRRAGARARRLHRAAVRCSGGCLKRRPRSRSASTARRCRRAPAKAWRRRCSRRVCCASATRRPPAPRAGRSA